MQKDKKAMVRSQHFLFWFQKYGSLKKPLQLFLSYFIQSCFYGAWIHRAQEAVFKKKKKI